MELFFAIIIGVTVISLLFLIISIITAPTIDEDEILARTTTSDSDHFHFGEAIRKWDTSNVRYSNVRYSNVRYYVLYSWQNTPYKKKEIKWPSDFLVWDAVFENTKDYISDGFVEYKNFCSICKLKSMEIVRVGKIQCKICS